MSCGTVRVSCRRPWWLIAIGLFRRWNFNNVSRFYGSDRYFVVCTVYLLLNQGDLGDSIFLMDPYSLWLGGYPQLLHIQRFLLVRYSCSYLSTNCINIFYFVYLKTETIFIIFPQIRRHNDIVEVSTVSVHSNISPAYHHDRSYKRSMSHRKWRYSHR